MAARRRIQAVGGPAGGLSCAQRIERDTTKRTQVMLTDKQVQDAEALFLGSTGFKDTDGTSLLSRGALTELMRQVGFQEVMGESFGTTVRLAFDAHSADSHFLTLPEFKQLYYLLSTKYPKVLPRRPLLAISIISAKGLPAADVNGKSDPFCYVQVEGKSRSRSQTRHIDKTLTPQWNEEFDDKYFYEQGDALEFSVMDYDPGEEADLLARTRLKSEDFHKPGGFYGDLPLETVIKGAKAPSLRVRVVVLAIEDQIEAEKKEASAQQAAEAKDREAEHLVITQNLGTSAAERSEKDQDKSKRKPQAAAEAPAATAADPGAASNEATTDKESLTAVLGAAAVA